MNNNSNIPNNNINMFNHNMNIQGNGCNNNNIFNNGNQNNAMLGNFQINNNMMNINQNNNLVQNTKKLPPHQVGLENIGQTCYMNASLQILTNIQSLTDPLLQKMSQNCINSQLQPLTFVFTLLTFQLKTSNQKYINPKIFKSVVGQLNPLFKGIQASDSKDFIFFVIERLHEELKPQNIPQNNNIINYAQQEIESRNEPLTHYKFINEFNKEITIIRNLFHGVTRSTLYCDGCKNKKYSFQVFNILNFVLKKVYEVKNHTFGGFLPENHPITLYDAFEAENKQEDLVGENMIFCNTCQALKSGWNKQELHTLPQILFIVLNRGKNNQDFRGKFTFDEIIEFNHNNLTFNLINQNSYKRYFLCGIVTHLGSSDSNGHFISYFRSDINQQFYCYNDASVAKVSVPSAMKSKISDIVEEDIVPYILFYHQY
jgi:ubiquitin C-terminal hydrolase